MLQFADDVASFVDEVWTVVHNLSGTFSRSLSVFTVSHIKHSQLLEDSKMSNRCLHIPLTCKAKYLVSAVLFT